MGKGNKSLKNRIVYWVMLTMLSILVYFAYRYYQSNNYNDFVRSEGKVYTSSFKRDDKIKYDDKMSYRIISPEFNDAMFYKTVKVEKNHAYKVSCMVKVDSVIAEKYNSGVGAQISIEGSTERSNAISGTTDWEKIELIFNSKNRESVNIGFRLGGYLGQAKGTAWFSDFKIEEGVADTSNEWKFACFIFEQVNVNLDGKIVKVKVDQNDISDITNTLDRFESTCKTLSNGKMEAKCDKYIIKDPLTSLSYDDEFAYYAASEDVDKYIRKTIKENDYDHIFIVVKLRRRKT